MVHTKAEILLSIVTTNCCCDACNQFFNFIFRNVFFAHVGSLILLVISVEFGIIIIKEF